MREVQRLAPREAPVTAREAWKWGWVPIVALLAASMPWTAFILTGATVSVTWPNDAASIDLVPVAPVRGGVPYDSGPVPLDDGGVLQCHRQCRVILGPGGEQSDAGSYLYRCGPCLIFCNVVDNGTREIVALVATDAGCAAWGDGGDTWFGAHRDEVP
jgi:hypothetical protein